MADIKMINDYYIKDETARNEIENIKTQINNCATKDDLGDINAILDAILGEEI